MTEKYHKELEMFKELGYHILSDTRQKTILVRSATLNVFFVEILKPSGEVNHISVVKEKLVEYMKGLK